ncbi:MAG: hypothetical protein Q4B54_01655, partial [Coriobacteriales bacterium]|nr:hypothetical protein [Coriobacteriales bacterium]
ARTGIWAGGGCVACRRVNTGLTEDYVIGWGAAAKDNEYMSVVDSSTGEKLLSVTQDDPKNFTYRCVYYE